MNYGEIKAAIVRRSHRTDLTARVPEFIALAEAEYNRRTDSAYHITDGADAVENWISSNAPDLYIFGGLWQLAIETDDDAALQKYLPLFERAVSTAQYAEAKEAGEIDLPMECDVGLVYTSNILEGTP
jgi:hypothetical protein